VVVFAVNRHQSEDLELTIGLRAFPDHQLVEHLVLDGDLRATNTQEQPDAVSPRTAEPASRDGAELLVGLTPVSWNVLRLQPAR
jgi:alpha-N-arabinofuranosidase